MTDMIQVDTGRYPMVEMGTEISIYADLLTYHISWDLI